MMNEQIRKLLYDAGARYDGHNHFTGKDRIDIEYLDHEKFAELIIEECYGAVNDALYHDYVFDNRPPAEIRKTALLAIREHFGVK